MRVIVFGAGSTGCYLSALFSLAGLETHIVARQRIIDELQQAGGIAISRLDGESQLAPLPKMHTTPPDLSFDGCLVTLKCHQLKSSIEDLSHLQEQCELHFLQNGLNSRNGLGTLQSDNCYAGIIPFNVLSMGHAQFHQGTEGCLQLQKTPFSRRLYQQLQQHSLDCELYDDISPVVHGKLLLNLNNALNAISDLPLKQELEDRKIRNVLAGAMSEYLAYCKSKGIALHIPSPIPASWLPFILRLPDWLFTRVARKMLDIDPLARSSMWEDLKQGRATEIDYLNGAVIELCESAGLPCVINQQISRVIKEIEASSENKKPGTRPGLKQLIKLI